MQCGSSNGSGPASSPNRHECGRIRPRISTEEPRSQRREKAPQNLGDVDSVSPQWAGTDEAMSKHGVQKTGQVVGKVGRRDNGLNIHHLEFKRGFRAGPFGPNARTLRSNLPGCWAARRRVVPPLLECMAAASLIDFSDDIPGTGPGRKPPPSMTIGQARRSIRETSHGADQLAPCHELLSGGGASL